MSNIPDDVLKSWRLNKSVCPHCGYVVDAASKAMGEKGGPTPGAIAICINCLHVNQYEDDGNDGLRLALFDLNELEHEQREELEMLLLRMRQGRN